MAALIPAFIAAVLVQPIVFYVRLGVMIAVSLAAGLSASLSDFQGWGMVIVYILIVAAGFVLLLGVPLFLALRRYRKLGWLSVALTGVLTAAVPFAVYSYPLWTDLSGSSSAGNWYGSYVKFIIDGQLTIYGWLSYVEGVLWFAIHGLAGAMVFYGVWLKLAKSPGDSKSR